MSARDTKVNMTDALDKADAAAKARLEAAAKERRLAEQRAAEAAAAAESARQAARQISAEPPMTARKRSLRSQSVVSQDDNFYEGDETSLEIHRIIESARNPVPEASMLRTRSANAGTKEPRSAMKGSREEALRPSAKTRAAGARRTVPMTPVPIDGERDVTFDEENQALGIAPRLASPSFVSPSPTPQPLHEDAPPADNNIFDNRQNSPPDTVGYDEGISNLPMSPASPSDGPKRARTPLPTPEQAPIGSWFSFGPAKTGFKSTINGIQKTVVIFGIFFKDLFGPLLYYLLLGFFIFGITALSYSFIQRSSYSTSIPPGSSDELIHRLMALEKQVVNFQKGQELEKRSQKTIEQQLASIRGAMATYSSVSSQLDKHTRNYQTDHRASSAAISKMSAQIEQFDKSIKRNDEAVKEQKGNLQLVSSQLTKMQGEVEGINTNLQSLQKSQDLSERALQRIEESLPKQLAARVDPQTGGIIVAPELLRYLQTVLRKDIQNEMDKFVRPSGGSPATGGSEGAMYNWQGFLKTNAAKLQGYIGEISEENWRKSISDGIVVTREDMMKVIREQLDSAREVAEKNNNDLMRKLVLEAEGAANNVASTAATSISSAALAAVTNYMRNFKGGSSTSSRYGDALIQAALHQYSDKILQKPDYALLAHGTLIDPRLTSSTFDPYDTPGLLGKLTAFLRPGLNEPAHVLTESTNIGDCWSFPQSSGQVSLLLAEPIYPTDVTIDHVPRGISGDISSAPQEVEFWVKIEDEFLRGQAEKAAAVAIGDVSDNASARNYLSSGYVRVASFVYDINSQYPIQTFELPIDLRKLGVSVRSVSFRILSNWGRKEYTSIYRLRVHGAPLNDKSGGQETAAQIQGL